MEGGDWMAAVGIRSSDSNGSERLNVECGMIRPLNDEILKF